MSLLSALETKEPAPSARVPPSQGWAPDPAPPPPPGSAPVDCGQCERISPQLLWAEIFALWLDTVQ